MRDERGKLYYWTRWGRDPPDGPNYGKVNFILLARSV